MAGHSKWSNIKHKKQAEDKKRAAIFNKLARAITIEAQRGGGDIETNYGLRSAVEKAKQANMPKDKIEHAIKRGTGELKDAAQIEEIILEGYGPGGTALLIKVITDNRNRTTAELRHLLSQHNAKLTGENSARFLFEKREIEKGVIEWEAKNPINVSEKDRVALKKLYEALDEHDDVQEIYSNEK